MDNTSGAPPLATSMSVYQLASRFMSWISYSGTDTEGPRPIALTNRPWKSWELDEGFFRALSRWTLDNPETTLDRVLDNIRDGLENSKDLLSLVPESPFPARGLVTALAYLLKLGISIRRAQRDVQEFAKDFVQWVGLVKSAFESAEDGGFARRAWRDLRHMRDLVDKMCLWAVDRLNDGRWLRIGHGLTIQKEILEFKERISTSRALFQDLSAINMTRGLDAVMQKLRALVSNQQNIIQEIREVRKTQKKQLSRIVNEMELQKQVAERERFFAETLNVHAIASPTYDSQGKRPCDEDTRMEILDDIRRWKSDIKLGSPNFLLLTGDPGCGKSSITASFTRECKDEGVLWAQFFVNRNNAETTNPRSYFPSIARQLANYSPEVAQAIHFSLVKQRSLTDDISSEQAAHLFTDAIRKASELDPDRPVVVVVDGLDETERKELKRTATIFSTLFTTLGAYSNVKIFISSRTENDIQKSFALPRNNRHVKRVHLSTADPSSIRDVSNYVMRNLLGLVKEHDLNWEAWPGDERSRRLGERASGLFIWAVTAIKFIQEQLELHGKECLNEILDLLTAEVLHDLNALYTMILTITYGQHQHGSDSWELERFRRIIGAIVCLQEPLCLGDLSELLDLYKTPSSEPVDVIHFVRQFRTILVTGADVVDETTVPRIHRSVYEFITSNSVDTQFRVDPNHAQLELAIQCLAYLHIAQWTSVEVLPVPSRYALRFWLSHLLQADITSPATLCIDYRQSPTTSLPPEIPAPWHYESAIPIRAQYSALASRLEIRSSDSLRSWDTTTGLTLSHISDVLGVIASPDSKDIVSWSRDSTIRIWGSTGTKRRRTLVRDVNCNAVALSPDGSTVVSASADGMVCLWDYLSGTMIWKSVHTSKSHTGVICVAFSRDGMWVISGSGLGSKTCKIWNARTGEMVGKERPWTGKMGEFVDVAISSNNRKACSIDDHGFCFIWDIDTGHQIASLRYDEVSLNFVSFAPNDDDCLVLAGKDGIRIRSHHQIWLIPNSRNAECVSFSPDGKDIIFGNGKSILVARIGQDKQSTHIIRRGDIDFPPNTRLRAFSPNWDFAYSTSQNVIHVHNLKHYESSLKAVLVNKGSYIVDKGGYQQLLDALPGMKAKHSPYPVTATGNHRLDTVKWYELNNVAKYDVKICIMTNKFTIAGYDDGSVSLWELKN